MFTVIRLQQICSDFFIIHKDFFVMVSLTSCLQKNTILNKRLWISSFNGQNCFFFIFETEIYILIGSFDVICIMS